MVTVPRSQSVGSGLSEKISRSIVDATKVRIPVSRGNVITIAAETIIATQIIADIVELISAEKKKIQFRLSRQFFERFFKSATNAQLSLQLHNKHGEKNVLWFYLYFSM